MDYSAVSHRSTPEFTYALDQNRVVVTLKTGKDIDSAYIIHEDPFIHELQRKLEWSGQRLEMELYMELEHHYLWKVVLTPKYKRLQYYFEIICQGQIYTLFENKLTEKEHAGDRSKQYFKFPWLNPSDVIAPPKWVSDTVWYQIMPDRFARDRSFVNPGKFRVWGDMKTADLEDIYGGNLRGITERLPYLKELGIGGIYMTPVFFSHSSHKYNTIDYRMIDPDFGTAEDMQELVRLAHKLGIKVMLDAVFNHCGYEFAPWQDVLKNGRQSPYFDWFFINHDNYRVFELPTDDARFYSFSFWSGMPKLNTNNPEVIRYFSDIAAEWVGQWKIDGIRFDVGDEVSHTFLRNLFQTLKAINPEVFLLGEIWNDSLYWVTGKEFDSVMNYPLSSCINDFWQNKQSTSTELMYHLNYCRSLYPQQVTECLFNFLDTHDTARAIESCANENVLLQKLAALIVLPGTPCIYYGTEIAMKGRYSPFNRSCMPWEEIDNGQFQAISQKVSQLIRLRKGNTDLQSNTLDYAIDPKHPRLVTLTKNKKITVYLNAGQEECTVPSVGKILYSNLYENGVLAKDGILIVEK